jgi:hypothetical protein
MTYRKQTSNRSKRRRKNFIGHRRCTQRVVSEHCDGQDGRYDDPKKEKRTKGRSSSNMMRNGFPNRSVRQRKQEGVEGALIE